MLAAILDQAQVLEQELALLDTTVRLDLTALCPVLPENTAPLQDFLFLQVTVMQAITVHTHLPQQPLPLPQKAQSVPPVTTASLDQGPHKTVL